MTYFPDSRHGLWNSHPSSATFLLQGLRWWLACSFLSKWKGERDTLFYSKVIVRISWDHESTRYGAWNLGVWYYQSWKSACTSANVGFLPSDTRQPCKQAWKSPLLHNPIIPWSPRRGREHVPSPTGYFWRWNIIPLFAEEEGDGAESGSSC